MQTLAAYLWVPVLVYAVATGLGLCAERVARRRVADALLAPVGLALAISLSMAVFELEGTAPVAAVLLALGGVAGLALGRRELRARIAPGWAAIAGLAAYVLFVGPSALTGHWTWAGYNFVNDPSVNFVYTNLLADNGFSLPAGPPSTAFQLQKEVLTIDYPLGAHALLAAFGPLSLVELAALYQPFIAVSAAFAAMALTVLLRRGGMPGPLAATTAVVAMGANLLYQYAQHGGIKEVLMVMLLAAAAAVLAEALADGLPRGAAAIGALCLVSTLAVFSAAAGPYVIALALVVLAAILLRPDLAPAKRVLAFAAVGVAAGVIASLPYLPGVITFAQGAAQGYSAERSGGATTEFGQLLRQLPWSQGAGVWFGEDYRLPVEPGRRLASGLQTFMVIAIGVLALVGLAAELLRRRPNLALLSVTAVAVAVGMSSRLGPYADAKLLLIGSPAVVASAGLGLWALSRPGVRSLLAAAVAVVLAGGILYSDAQAAHNARFAPTERMEALVDAAEHAPAGGSELWLINEWEEFAKHFVRRVPANPAAESYSPRSVQLRTPGPVFGRYFDLDDQLPDYVGSFAGIIRRRNPVASRPPANFRRIHVNDYYEVWRRDPGPAVVEHLPLQGPNDATAVAPCDDVRALAGRMEPGESLVASVRPAVRTFPLDSAPDRPVGWPPNPEVTGSVQLKTPGRVRGTITTSGGLHRVWLRGSTGRPVSISIDGREVGAPSGVNTPGQWLEAGVVRLTPGDHAIVVERPGGRPLPGDGYRGEGGPVALEPVEGPQRLTTVDRRDAERLCDGRFDWIERVRR